MQIWKKFRIDQLFLSLSIPQAKLKKKILELLVYLIVCKQSFIEIKYYRLKRSPLIRAFNDPNLFWHRLLVLKTRCVLVATF